MSANGVSAALMSFRERALVEAGFTADKAAETAPAMQSKLRSDVVAEAVELAKGAGVYRAPEPPVDDSPDDPGDLAAKFSHRRRH